MSQAPMSSDVTSDDKLWAALAYVFSPLVPIILMLMEDKKNRPYIRANNAQALVLGIITIITSTFRAIFFVSFVAILREGIELALFLTASVFATSNTLKATFGAILGLGTAILLGWLIFATTVRLDLRRFFQVTSFMLVLFAAGLIARGVYEFTLVGWIPSIMDHVWDLTSIVSAESTVGQLLGALFGYNPTPSLSEAIAYISYFAGVLIALQFAGRKSQPGLI